MAKIIDGDSLVVSSSLVNLGTDGNIWIDTTAKTFTFAVYGDLTSAKEGVTLQALYSKYIKLWETASYNKYAFPMYVIDAKSGQFNFGFDGGSYNGWKPADDATRQMLRDGGWNEYSNAGVLNRQYVGIVSLGDVNTGAQLYYQRAAVDAPIDFTFDDEVNEGIQVYGDTTNGNFDKRTFFKAFAREEQKKYKTSTLADTGQTATGAYTVNVLLSNEDDLDVLVNDAGISSGIYTGINVSYYNTNQLRDLNSPSDDYPFRIIVEGNNGTLQQIYTKVQYLLRQNSDINTSGNAGAVTGATADDLMYFVGPDLYCRQGVFIDNLNSNFLNNVYFIDHNGVPRQYNYASAGTINFNSYLQTGSAGYYRMYITDSVTGTDDYGTANAITLNDKDGSPIAGTIDAASKSFTFAYDTNTQGGRSVFTSPGGDVGITLVAGNKGYAKPVVITGTVTRSKGISFSLVAEQDRAYVA
jgi:hypothetical protein